MCLRNNSAHAIQNLQSFLIGRSKHGAVYTVGNVEQIRDISYFQKVFTHSERTGSDRYDSTPRGGEPPTKTTSEMADFAFHKK